MSYQDYMRIKEKRDNYLNRCRSAWTSGNVTPKDDLYGKQAIQACKQYEQEHGLELT